METRAGCVRQVHPSRVALAAWIECRSESCRLSSIGPAAGMPAAAESVRPISCRSRPTAPMSWSTTTADVICMNASQKKPWTHFELPWRAQFRPPALVPGRAARNLQRATRTGPERTGPGRATARSHARRAPPPSRPSHFLPNNHHHHYHHHISQGVEHVDMDSGWDQQRLDGQLVHALLHHSRAPRPRLSAHVSKVQRGGKKSSNLAAAAIVVDTRAMAGEREGAGQDD